MTKNNTSTLVSKALKQVIEPDLNINLVDAGLIYDIQVINSTAKIELTLPTPGSELSKQLKNQIITAVTSVKEITKCQINLVWYPVWTPNKIKVSSQDLTLKTPAKPLPQVNKVIDFNTPIKQFADKYPDFVSIMYDLGFTKIINPVLLNTAGRIVTIKKGAQMLKLDLDNIERVFKKKGYTVHD